MVQKTSLLAYAEVLENLGERQMQVLKAIEELVICNNLMISKHLNLPINSVTPRVRELRGKRLVREFKKGECPITGKMTMFWTRIKK